MSDPILARPVFQPFPKGVRAPGPPFPYEKVISVVRDHNRSEHGDFRTPGLIAVWKDDTFTIRQRRANEARTKIRHWLTDNFPLENWELKISRVPNTWAKDTGFHMGLWICYVGDFPDLEAAKAGHAARLARFHNRRKRKTPKKEKP